MSPRIRLGTQGWTYPAWVGTFFPEGTRAHRHLTLYAQAFGAVELDSTFYAVPSASTVRSWVRRTPDGFSFSPKVPREITHDRRLRDVSAPLHQFLERMRELEGRLGPILIQLGPDFSPEERPALEQFLDLLPEDLRFAVEFRQSGWISAETHQLLAERRIALVLSDGQWLPRGWVLALAGRPTAAFHYVRWMGADRSITDFSHVQLDRGDELAEWAGALRGVGEAVTEVFGYFNNYFAGHAPASARDLQRLLGQRPVEPNEVGEQTTLF